MRVCVCGVAGRSVCVLWFVGSVGVGWLWLVVVVWCGGGCLWVAARGGEGVGRWGGRGGGGGGTVGGLGVLCSSKDETGVSLVGDGAHATPPPRGHLSRGGDPPPPASPEVFIIMS